MLFLSIVQLSTISLGKWEKHLHLARSTENTKENASDMAWLGGQKFSGWDKNFSTIVEKFYPWIKIFGGTIFFLTAPNMFISQWIMQNTQEKVSVRRNASSF